MDAANFAVLERLGITHVFTYDLLRGSPNKLNPSPTEPLHVAARKLRKRVVRS